MKLTEGLLVVIVIILIFVIVARPRASATGGSRTWDCVDRASGDITSVQMKYLQQAQANAAGVSTGATAPGANAPEAGALAETVEHFQGCMNGPSVMPDVNSCDGTFDYAVNAFGAPGMEYKDWVATQAVDPAVIKNHAEFVKDRVGQGSQIITGRTYAMPDHESYQPVPWIGIRARPTRVAICNPTQMTDADVGYYPLKQKLIWRD